MSAPAPADPELTALIATLTDAERAELLARVEADTEMHRRHRAALQALVPRAVEVLIEHGICPDCRGRLDRRSRHAACAWRHAGHTAGDDCR